MMDDNVAKMIEEARKLDAEAALARAWRNLRGEQQPWRAYIPIAASVFSAIALILCTATVVLPIK